MLISNGQFISGQVQRTIIINFLNLFQIFNKLNKMIKWLLLLIQKKSVIIGNNYLFLKDNIHLLNMGSYFYGTFKY